MEKDTVEVVMQAFLTVFAVGTIGIFAWAIFELFAETIA